MRNKVKFQISFNNEPTFCLHIVSRKYCLFVYICNSCVLSSVILQEIPTKCC